jgi:hypothetical protein
LKARDIRHGEEWRDGLPKENNPNQPIKVTDKRIFDSDGEIKEEFRTSVTPVEATAQAPKPAETPRSEPPAEDKKKKNLRDRAANPGTLFTNFVETLVVNAYMSLGMLRGPGAPPTVDAAAARQMIDILTMLAEKTQGNLTEDESDFLDAHLGELKLHFVRATKSV